MVDTEPSNDVRNSYVSRLRIRPTVQPSTSCLSLATALTRAHRNMHATPVTRTRHRSQGRGDEQAIRRRDRLLLTAPPADKVDPSHPCSASDDLLGQTEPEAPPSPQSTNSPHDNAPINNVIRIGLRDMSGVEPPPPPPFSIPLDPSDSHTLPADDGVDVTAGPDATPSDGGAQSIDSSRDPVLTRTAVFQPPTAPPQPGPPNPSAPPAPDAPTRDNLVPGPRASRTPTGPTHTAARARVPQAPAVPAPRTAPRAAAAAGAPQSRARAPPPAQQPQATRATAAPRAQATAAGDWRAAAGTGAFVPAAAERPPPNTKDPRAAPAPALREATMCLRSRVSAMLSAQPIPIREAAAAARHAHPYPAPAGGHGGGHGAAVGWGPDAHHDGAPGYDTRPHVGHHQFDPTHPPYGVAHEPYSAAHPYHHHAPARRGLAPQPRSSAVHDKAAHYLAAAHESPTRSYHESAAHTEAAGGYPHHAGYGAQCEVYDNRVPPHDASGHHAGPEYRHVAPVGAYPHAAHGAYPPRGDAEASPRAARSRWDDVPAYAPPARLEGVRSRKGLRCAAVASDSNDDAGTWPPEAQRGGYPDVGSAYAYDGPPVHTYPEAYDAASPPRPPAYGSISAQHAAHSAPYDGATAPVAALHANLSDAAPVGIYARGSVTAAYSC